jgi:hypothetical protein
MSDHLVQFRSRGTLLPRFAQLLPDDGKALVVRMTLLMQFQRTKMASRELHNGELRLGPRRAKDDQSNLSRRVELHWLDNLG